MHRTMFDAKGQGDAARGSTGEAGATAGRAGTGAKARVGRALGAKVGGER